MCVADKRSFDELKKMDRRRNFYSWSIQGTLDPLMVSHARGMYVYDVEGREYLDFSSQLVNVNIGHSHPVVVQAIADQAAQLATVAPAFSSIPRVDAATMVVERAGEGFEKVFFTNGGADANENAIRAARLFTGRTKVLSTYRSYHGNTGSAIVATGDWRRQPNEYATGHVHFYGPFAYRSEFFSTSEEQECERALAHLERVMQGEGPDTIAAVLLESVPGTAGIMVPPPGYLAGVRALCDRYGIMLILDEVMCGFGRTGSWMAFHAHDVTPDLITFAKGVNSGYVPVGGVIFSSELARYFDDHMFPGGLTYSGHPLAMASIVAALGVMESEKMLENATMIGEEHLRGGLAQLASAHPVVGDVRGVGCFFALDLVVDPATKEPLGAPAMGAIKKELMARNLLPFVVDNRIHVVPPLIVTPDQVAQALAVYDEALTAAGF
ncbi:MAG: aspartate aminotransferase family protein [Microbacteriaceae bacterium]|nr:aspartate aminotransferase family protein [Microbacteriaceae bacterium]